MSKIGLQKQHGPHQKLGLISGVLEGEAYSYDDLSMLGQVGLCKSTEALIFVLIYYHG